MITYLARTGEPNALALLLKYYRHQVATSDEEELAEFGLNTLAFLPSKLVIDDYRRYLERLSAKIEQSMLDSAEIPRTLAWASIWRSAGLAAAILKINGSDEDKELLDFPIPLDAEFDALLPFVENPADLINLYYNALSSRKTERINQWTDGIGARTCAAIDFRTTEEINELIPSVRTIFDTSVAPVMVADFETMDEARALGVSNSFDFVHNLSMSDCRLNRSMVYLNVYENAEKEEKRKFERISYEPRWWVRPIRAKSIMASLHLDPAQYNFDGLSQYDTDWLLSQIPDRDKVEPEFLDIFELHHRLLTDAFQSPDWHYGFNAERRIFRFRNRDGEGPLSVAGQVDVVPIISDGQLLIAVKNQILWPSYSNLFIPEILPEKRAEYEENYRLKMFDRITLEKEGVVSEATYNRTLPDGVHIFTVPFNGDLSSTYLRINMKIHLLNSTEILSWPLDFALYESHLAFNLQRGRDAK